ncbi:MAG: hypothetical protein ABJP79_08930 [Tateyamaria sp.]
MLCDDPAAKRGGMRFVHNQRQKGGHQRPDFKVIGTQQDARRKIAHKRVSVCEVVLEVTTDHAGRYIAVKKGFFPAFHSDNDVLPTHGGRIGVVAYGVRCPFGEQNQVPDAELFSTAIKFDKGIAPHDEMKLGKTGICDGHLPMTAKVLLKIDRAFEADKFQNIA